MPKSRQVDLIVDVNGTPTVAGRVIVGEDGSVVGKITKDISADMKLVYFDRIDSVVVLVKSMARNHLTVVDNAD